MPLGNTSRPKPLISVPDDVTIMLRRSRIDNSFGDFWHAPCPSRVSTMSADREKVRVRIPSTPAIKSKGEGLELQWESKSHPVLCQQG